MTCYLLWSPISREAFFRLERSWPEFLLFFLVQSLHFDPLVLCNLITEIVFWSADYYNNSEPEISLQNFLLLVLAIF